MENSQDARPKPAWVEIVLGLLDVTKAAFWPMLVLAAFISLYEPLHTLIKELPDVLGRADVITIGQLNIKLNKALAVEASQDVREAVKGLSSSAARRLIQLTVTYVVCSFQGRNPSESAADHQLQIRGLATTNPRPDKNDADKSECYDVKPTDLGKKTQSFLVNVLANTLTLGAD